MKRYKINVLFIISFLTFSSLLLPAIAFAQENGEEEDVEDSEEYGAFDNFHGGFGGVFSDMGYGGELIGSLFEMLLLDGLDLEDHEELESVYVLSASKEETYEGNYSFAENQDTMEIHYLPFYNSTGGTANQYRTDTLDGYAYCVVEKEGGFNYNLTVGAALTLIIWDYDKSFITAAQKVLDWAARYREAEEKDKVSRKLIAEGVQVLSWLLVHINEIFTGDELFVFNPIVWQTLDMDPWIGNFNIEKTWYDSGDNGNIEFGDGDDTDLTSDPILTEWNISASLTKDSYMQWLLQDFDTADIAETIWTQFSFDVAQLWMKEFYIEIDLGEVAKGEDAKMEKAFEGCDIEFYLFTHHLAGAFLYYDNDTSRDVTVDYDYARNETTGEILYSNGTAIMVPTSNEVTHRLVLGTVDDFDFKEPKIDDTAEKVEWGLQLNKVNMSAVPVGVDLNSYVNAPEEELDFIYFGLDFEIDVEEPNDKGEIEAEGDLKLETNWAPWNGLNGPNNPSVIGEDLDLCIVYISSILHFDLDMERDDDPDDPDDDLLEDNDFKNETHTLKIGNYLDASEDDLEFIDIAGPGYIMGNDTNNDGYPDSGYISGQVDTSIIPIALYESETQSREVDKGDEDDTDDDFSTDAEAEAEWNIMLYAVCYPEFNSTGLGIWHDPTFSVYMVFTPEEPSFWALIILIAAVGLAGVATIIIKRRKDGTW